MSTLGAGERAPASDLPHLESRPHRLEDVLAQGPALAVFWKSTCDTCYLTLPISSA